MSAKNMHDEIAAAGYRLFAIRITPADRRYEVLVCKDKTVEQFRADVSAFIGKPFTATDWVEDALWNALHRHLTDLGYEEVLDIVSDVYEGRISCTSAVLVNDPDHEQMSGFGHFGWESKQSVWDANPKLAVVNVFDAHSAIPEMSQKHLHVLCELKNETVHLVDLLDKLAFMVGWDDQYLTKEQILDRIKEAHSDGVIKIVE